MLHGSKSSINCDDSHGNYEMILGVPNFISHNSQLHEPCITIIKNTFTVACNVLLQISYTESNNIDVALMGIGNYVHNMVQ